VGSTLILSLVLKLSHNLARLRRTSLGKENAEEKRKTTPPTNPNGSNIIETSYRKIKPK
jgi:hypothetical protein